jgi:Cof subfamily protein (haloacid dehalogenase superfamily)
MKYPIKMIVTDLDGTLLRDDKSISESTVSALMRCRESGIKVAYATGRGKSVNKVAPVELFDARITENGAVVAAGYHVLRNLYIPYKITRPILMACDSRGLKASSEDYCMHYTNFDATGLWPPTNFEIVDFSRHEIDAQKLVFFLNSPEDEAFVEKSLPEDFYLVVGKGGIAQVMRRDAAKSKGAARLAEFWGIAQGEIAAFGDDLNDTDLLSYAGVGVAMGNAPEELKAAADFVCATNEEDGVADWIVKNLF